ncbi:MAG: hypothetical protein ACYTEY_06610, partial [Planctomycetota bacterium]
MVRLPVIDSIDDVVDARLCCGCGACAYASPDRFEMVDTVEEGRRPRRRDSSANGAGDSEALAVCPGLGLEHT